MLTPNIGMVEIGSLIASGYIFYVLLKRFVRNPPTRLKGPSSRNFLFGIMPRILNAPDSDVIYEEWAAQYGSVFSIPATFGSRNVVLTDPKTIAHFAARETYGYIGTPRAKRIQEKLFGKGLVWAEDDSHKRRAATGTKPGVQQCGYQELDSSFLRFYVQGKLLSSADKITHVVNRRKPRGMRYLNVGLRMERQSRFRNGRMNHISLDTIGLAGFAHDFGTLSGKMSTIAKAFDEIGSKPSFLDTVSFILSLIIPFLSMGVIPTARGSLLNQLTKEMRALGDKFLETTSDVTTDKSVIGLLVKSASSEQISQEEVRAQINVLLLAGYETTAISLTWALIELSRNPAIQTKLREELLQLGGDPNWEELNKHGSFLDAVACEILRCHPPLAETDRMAAEDDILPLSMPIETIDGQVVDSLFVHKGTIVTLPIACLNRSEAFWGPTAKDFSPARWLDEAEGIDKHRARELQGYRHLLTFVDGARMCLGKTFALVEFKAVLSVLVRNYTFEFPNGAETALGRHRNILFRPKVEGETGYGVPLKIRPYLGSE
ncbi:Cytochrome P450 [Mycena sanguinolenta]|uniref:Cytochrome P450 n=1 Tax=Mycena sanguinolenta TaxID=230812 RepID=A0A8H7CV55_9AGAR|nr:Cytochrome P450 [Mycena sanguinolenta]